MSKGTVLYPRLADNVHGYYLYRQCRGVLFISPPSRRRHTLRKPRRKIRSIDTTSSTGDQPRNIPEETSECTVQAAAENQLEHKRTLLPGTRRLQNAAWIERE